jgi:hypothetical protein
MAGNGFKSFLAGVGRTTLKVLSVGGEIAQNPMVAGGLAAIAGPAAIPALNAFVKIANAAATIEARHVEAGKITGTGAEKQAFVVQDYLDSLEAINAELSLHGKQLVVPLDKLKAANDAVVAALNACRELRQSTELKDLPKE